MKILSFTHPQVVANPYEFLFSAEHKGRYFEEWLEPNSCGAPLTFIVEKNTMQDNGAKQLFGSNHSSKYLTFCNRFSTTWGWV